MFEGIVNALVQPGRDSNDTLYEESVTAVEACTTGWHLLLYQVSKKVVTTIVAPSSTVHAVFDVSTDLLILLMTVVHQVTWRVME